MTLFLGIDGGQSSTTALIADDTGRVLGHGRGGPCNHVAAAEGRAKFFAAIGGCVEQACGQAGLDPAAVRFAAACGGFSGGPHDKDAYFRELIRADHYEVTVDSNIALAGANAGEPAVITIGGTGSISYGRNSQGKLARAGGWGYVYGDEGGGFDITRQALRAALRMEEGWGPETSLKDALLSASREPDVNALMHAFYTPDWPRPRIASLSRIVDQQASEGDIVARNILLNAAQDLATITTAVRAQLFEEEEPVFVAYVGGVFRSQLVLERYRMLLELGDGTHIGPPKHGPAAGALIEAFRISGRSVLLSHVPEFEK